MSSLTEQLNVSAQCPVIDISLCVEPCVLFVNRRGCRECTCPVAHSTTENSLAESSTSSPVISDTSSADEPRTSETEQVTRMFPLLFIQYELFSTQ